MPDKHNKPCLYCGNNQIPHFTHWYFETVNILLTPVRRLLFYNAFSKFLGKLLGRLGLAYGFLYSLVFLKLVSFQEDVKKCQVRRAQVLWEAAGQFGIKMRQVVFLGKALDCYVAENSSKKFRSIFFGLPRPRDARGDALDWMDDKQIFKEYFQKHNLPVAGGGSVTGLRGARKIFQKIQKPVIVKPRAGSRGRHSTTFVYTLNNLKEAFKAAKQLCYWAVVEEQLFGPVYRATLINFELCGVLRGDPPQVTGDGISSVRSLVENKNSAKHAGVKNILWDVSTEKFLERQGLSAESVLSKGQKVMLTEKIGVNYGGSSSEDFEICHPENKKLFTKAAKSLGDPIVGFDFIIPDISRPWQEQKCGFIEANSLPFINLHHDPLLGRPRNVAVKVWEMILASK